jgi:cell fate regulator YaaT (PSP1 superfamily)
MILAQAFLQPSVKDKINKRQSNPGDAAQTLTAFKCV